MVVCRVKHETTTKAALQLTSNFRFHRVAVGETCSNTVGTEFQMSSYRGQEELCSILIFQTLLTLGQKNCSHLGDPAAASMSDEMVKV